MAKVLSDGSFSGKVGNLVYSVRNGKTYVKGYVKPKDPKTTKQLERRAMLSAVSSFLAPFRKVFNTSFQGSEAKSSGYYEALDYHMLNALRQITKVGSKEPQFQIIIEKMKVARGAIKPPQITSCIKTGNSIELMWDSKLTDEMSRDYDGLAVVGYMAGEKVDSNFHLADRRIGSGVYELPAEFTGNVHLWVFYLNEKNGREGKECISDSVYLGEI